MKSLLMLSLMLVVSAAHADVTCDAVAINPPPANPHVVITRASSVGLFDVKTTRNEYGYLNPESSQARAVEGAGRTLILSAENQIVNLSPQLLDTTGAFRGTIQSKKFGAQLLRCTGRL